MYLKYCVENSKKSFILLVLHKFIIFDDHNYVNSMTGESFFSKKTSINIGGNLHYFNKPWVMGILNITPDSFYDGGRYVKDEDIINKVRQFVDEGADIIDVGAYSTRPKAENISIEEEKERLSTALFSIRKNFPGIILSVDTFRAEIARYVTGEFNVNMINDISGGNFDSNMFSTIADIQVPYVIMHIKGTPQNMQNNPVYVNLVDEVMKYFAERVQKLKLLGVNDIIIDPGFGFGKSISHNYQLLEKLAAFRCFELPVMVGVSRKSMIYKILETKAEESLNGTTVINTLALNNGADILRVHDVKAAREVVALMDKYRSVNERD